MGEVAKRFGPAALVAEFGRTSGAQKRSADLNNASHVARTELAELTLDQSLPALAHSIDRHALIERAAGDGAYGRIHARGITATRQDRDLLHKSDIIAVRPGCSRQPAAC